jgi:hypothetical protein
MKKIEVRDRPDLCQAIIIHLVRLPLKDPRDFMIYGVCTGTLGGSVVFYAYNPEGKRQRRAVNRALRQLQVEGLIARTSGRDGNNTRYVPTEKARRLFAGKPRINPDLSRRQPAHRQLRLSYKP